ncbi:MAG: glycosyltransferase family 2 protein [Aeriscardovia sp.]|nr:glycosyltransferase family 2 protein [Aeriscardovia sp.]
MRKLVSILVPCYNEELSLRRFYTEVIDVIDSIDNYAWEILFINDGSKDRTLEVIKEFYEKDKRISYIDLARNFGKESAMLAGFDYVKGDSVIIMDADLQDPPSLIPQMLDLWEEGYQDVYAKRKSRGKESWLRRMMSLSFYYILDKATRYEVLQNVGDFRLLDRKCINALKQLRENERYTKGLFCWIGYKKKEILFDRGDRIAGQSNWGFGALFDLAIEGITSFTTTPLRIATFVGIIVAIWALGYMAWIIFKVFMWGDPVAGYPTIMTVMLFLGAVQLIAIGILGEYIGRIFNETKNRPTYLVNEYKERMSNIINSQ